MRYIILIVALGLLFYWLLRHKGPVVNSDNSKIIDLDKSQYHHVDDTGEDKDAGGDDAGGDDDLIT